jgi:hypothetical protein
MDFCNKYQDKIKFYNRQKKIIITSNMGQRVNIIGFSNIFLGIN